MGLLDVLGGAAAPPARSRGMSPMTMALLALLAYKAFQRKGGGLGGMLGGANASPGRPSGGGPNLVPAQSGDGLGGLLKGALGGLLAGGAAGGLLNGGLNDLLRQFQQQGLGDVANSWVATGPNRPVSPPQIEQALGPETVNSLAEQAGMPRAELLDGLSDGLPDLVDQLTPEGRVPDPEEASRWV
jgi:uncharacterized protein YidB (DUF937 family)